MFATFLLIVLLSQSSGPETRPKIVEQSTSNEINEADEFKIETSGAIAAAAGLSFAVGLSTISLVLESLPAETSQRDILLALAVSSACLTFPLGTILPALAMSVTAALLDKRYWANYLLMLLPGIVLYPLIVTATLGPLLAIAFVNSLAYQRQERDPIPTYIVVGLSNFVSFSLAAVIIGASVYVTNNAE